MVVKRADDMRAEQSNSGACQPLGFGRDAVGSAAVDSPDERASCGRDRRLPGSPTKAVEQLLWGAHEDLAAITEILRSLQCSAHLCDSDGATIRLPPAAISIGQSNSNSDFGSAALSAPIYDSQGRHFASVQVIHGSADSGPSLRLLRAVIESTARSITERCFRLAHRREWVVAAMRRDLPGSYQLFAVDQGQRLLGADRKARQWLQTSRGLRFERSVALATLFRSGVGTLPPRNCGDTEVNLVTRSGEGWLGLVTPPNIGADLPFLDQRAVLHARPRLNSLTRSWPESDGGPQHDLAGDSFRRVRAYIDAHLGSRLDVNVLARIVGLSASHFSRAFQRAAGVPPHRYVMQCRVIRARELLATTRLSLTEIALASGFADHSHFSRRFHEFMGVAPRDFRRLIVRPPR
jgi:AraC-like DNA-binding protein